MIEDLPLRERRRLARLARSRSRVLERRDGQRAETIARHVLSSDAYKYTTLNWIYLGVGVMAGILAIVEWRDPVGSTRELPLILAFNAVITLYMGLRFIRDRGAYLETARVNGWTWSSKSSTWRSETGDVRPPLPKSSG